MNSVAVCVAAVLIAAGEPPPQTAERPMAEEREALRAILRVSDAGVEPGALAKVDWFGGGGPGAPRFTDREMALLRFLPNVERLNIPWSDVTDAGFASLSGLRRLQRLEAWRTKTDGSGLRYVRGLTALTEVQLSQTRVTDSALENLRAWPTSPPSGSTSVPT